MPRLAAVSADVAAEEAEAALDLARAKSAKLASYIGQLDHSDFAAYAGKDEAAQPRNSRNEDRLALDLLLSKLMVAAPARPSRTGPAAVAEASGTNAPAADAAAADEAAAAPAPGRKMKWAIASNRGLTRIRPKKSGNSRVAYRQKFDKKMKKFAVKNKVADPLQAHGGYDGESHGITIHVNRARKID